MKTLTATLTLFAVLSGSAAHAPATLKQNFRPYFYIGASINAAQIEGDDKRGDPIILSQFDSISPEHALKWEAIHAHPDKYDFSLADKYVAFGQKHKMWIVGHTLVWHYQIPGWVFYDSHGKLLTRKALLARMHDYIFKVVGRYKGRIDSWDVVNEALNEDGTLRPTMWERIIGPDYIEKAFEYAHEADPKAQLTYNDYNLTTPAKLAGAIRLVRQLRSEHVAIDCVGMQNHDTLESPTPAQEDAAITTLAKAGVCVNISELDVDVLPAGTPQNTADLSVKTADSPELNPWPNGLPDSVQQELAHRYAALFRVFVKDHKDISRVTFWDVTDADSWKNNWPIEGRANYPLLFDRAGRPKPAFYAVLSVATGHGQLVLNRFRHP